MLVSVSERTREVGLLKALGASRGQVLRAFLVEAALLSTAGGVARPPRGVGRHGSSCAASTRLSRSSRRPGPSRRRSSSRSPSASSSASSRRGGPPGSTRSWRWRGGDVNARRRPPPRPRLGDGPPAPVGADRPRDRHRHRLGRPPDLARRGDAAGDPLGVLAVRDEHARRDVGEDRDPRDRGGGGRDDAAADARRRRGAARRAGDREGRPGRLRDGARLLGRARAATRSSTAPRPTGRTVWRFEVRLGRSSPSRSSSGRCPSPSSGRS